MENKSHFWIVTTQLQGVQHPAEVILEDLHNTELLTYQVGLIINGAIDAAISLAATEFTAVQQAAIKSLWQKPKRAMSISPPSPPTI